MQAFLDSLDMPTRLLALADTVWWCVIPACLTCSSPACGGLTGGDCTRLVMPLSVGLVMFSALLSSSNCPCNSNPGYSTS